VREIAMELIQNDFSSEDQNGRECLVLPSGTRPVFFVEAHRLPSRSPASRQGPDGGLVGVRSERASWFDNRKRGDVEAKGLAFSLLIANDLGRKCARVECDHQDEDEPSQEPEMAQHRLKNNFRLVHGIIHL
jgi:hypothetical protein